MKSVFFCLSARLEVYPIEEPKTVLTLGSREFNRICEYDSNGFYDWLRQSSGSIIGVRYFIFEEYLNISDELRALTSVEAYPNDPCFYLFLGEERDYEESLSADQLFYGDYVYRSDDGTLGMSFELPTGRRL